ncbi:MAG: T9SS type A sorting domain-containing protein [Bacteroidota bacterium]|nr:T9SS type A sorting domain-containing protein [Bacteroidota bacterium]
MKTKITKLCILVIMTIAGITKVAGASAYCYTFTDPSGITGTTDAFYITWETNANGQVMITMDPFGANPYALFRNFNLGSLTVNGAASSTYFTVSYSGSTAVPAPTNRTYNKQVILTPIAGVTIPSGATLAFNGALEYMTANTGALNNLWPTVTFTYTYGTSCTGVAKVTTTPGSINFTPTQGTQTFSLNGLNLTGNLTLTASQGLSVSPTTITPEADGTIAAANQTATVTWVGGATTGGKITISGGGLVNSMIENVTSSGFSEFCNTVISQDGGGVLDLAYLTVGTSADRTQVIFNILPYDTSTGATAILKNVGTIKVNGTTVTPTITYSTDKTMATATFSNALSNGDVITFGGGALVWGLTGTLWNNNNCFQNNANKTYTVGLGCSVAQADNIAPAVVGASMASATSYNAVISVNATDNIGVTNIHFIDAANGIDVTQAAKSDNGAADYAISNLQGNTTYSFVIKALDLAGNETAIGDAKTVSFTTLHTPQITAIPNSLDFTPTAGSKTFTLSGAYVTDGIQLSAPVGYIVTPSTLTPIDGTIASTTVTVNWLNGLGNKIVVNGGGLQNPVKLIDLTYSGGFSDYCSYVITQGGGATLTTPALVNISLNTDKTILTYEIAPFDITGDATWNGNSLGANIILLNGVAATATRTQVDSHTITITFSQALTIGDVISYAPGTTMVWTTSGYTNYGNNGNCYIDGWSKTYTVGQTCNLNPGPTTSTPSISEQELNVYPNPANDKINITGEVAQVAIYSVQGQLVHTSFNKHTVDVSSFAKGFYFVKVTDKLGNQKSSKLEIQ